MMASFMIGSSVSLNKGYQDYNDRVVYGIEDLHPFAIYEVLDISANNQQLLLRVDDGSTRWFNKSFFRKES